MGQPVANRLDRLLRPRSLVFIGGAAAELAVEATLSFGFDGDIWAVNPRRALRGVPERRWARTVAELPALMVGPPDAAFVGVDAAASIGVVRDLAAVGAGVAVCHASGFAEVGCEGSELQRQLTEAAGHMPLVGPNCYGTLSAVTGAALWPDTHGLQRCERGVALISQSGNIAVNLTMARRHMPVAHVITVGNQADVGVAEAFEAVAGDEAVTGVGLYIEAIDHVARFVAAARTALGRGLPVAVLKAGSSQSASAITATHTASLAGTDSAYGALFRRLGLRRVSTPDELLDTLAVVGSLGPLAGNRIVSLSCSGGEAALVADLAQRHNLDFPALDSDHRRRVAASLDNRVAVNNPLDYHTFIWGDEARLTRCFRSVLGVHEPQHEHPTPAEVGSGAQAWEHVDDAATCPFDAAMLLLDFPAEGLDRSRWWPTLRAFADACSAANTPGVLVSSLAENLPGEARLRAAELGLACCVGVPNALSALEAAANLGSHHRAQSHTTEPEPASSGDAACPTAALTEHQAKQWLASAGVTVPEGELVAAGDAVVAAERVGYPVVVKASGLAHKSDRCAVSVALNHPGEVESAAVALAALGDGRVLVEQHAADAVAELLVSVRSEPPVGMMLTLGAGGTLVEVLDDTASLLLPPTPGEVRSALQGLRVGRLLGGHRGKPAGSLDAVERVVDALTKGVRSDRSVLEIEINPLLVTPDAAVAVDALIVAVT